MTPEEAKDKAQDLVIAYLKKLTGDVDAKGFDAAEAIGGEILAAYKRGRMDEACDRIKQGLGLR